MLYKGYEIEIEAYGVDEDDNTYCLIKDRKQVKNVAFASIEEAKKMDRRTNRLTTPATVRMNNHQQRTGEQPEGSKMSNVQIIVVKSKLDAARPWAVMLPEGFINRVKGRYATKEQANAAARRLKKRQQTV